MVEFPRQRGSRGGAEPWRWSPKIMSLCHSLPVLRSRFGRQDVGGGNLFRSSLGFSVVESIAVLTCLFLIVSQSLSVIFAMVAAVLPHDSANANNPRALLATLAVMPTLLGVLQMLLDALKIL